jgi:hypothetical protein
MINFYSNQKADKSGATSTPMWLMEEIKSYLAQA